jgi:hypothetical protein
MSNLDMSVGVVVVFAADGRQVTLADGKSANLLKPGVEVYDAAGKVLFRSKLEVLSVTVSGQQIAT